MTANVKGVLRGCYSAEDIGVMLKHAGFSVTGYQHGQDAKDSSQSYTAFVSFVEKQEAEKGATAPSRSVFVLRTPTHDYCGVTAASKEDGPLFTVVSIGSGGEAEDVIQAIVERSGGWINKNDSGRVDESNDPKKWAPVAASFPDITEQLSQAKISRDSGNARTGIGRFLMGIAEILPISIREWWIVNVAVRADEALAPPVPEPVAITTEETPAEPAEPAGADGTDPETIADGEASEASGNEPIDPGASEQPEAGAGDAPQVEPPAVLETSYAPEQDTSLRHKHIFA